MHDLKRLAQHFESLNSYLLGIFSIDDTTISFEVNVDTRQKEALSTEIEKGLRDAKMQAFRVDDSTLNEHAVLNFKVQTIL